jgi:NAD(P)H-hydrate repair Nnr-like enzyme with NAD(P)H-hydrate dehydratase domain
MSLFGVESSFGLAGDNLQFGGTGDHIDGLRAAYAAAGYELSPYGEPAPVEHAATAASTYFEELGDRLAAQGVVFPGGNLAVRNF